MSGKTLLLAVALSFAGQVVNAQESDKSNIQPARNKGQLQSAEKECRAQIDQLTASKAPPPQLAKASHELAAVLVEEGRPAEAEALYNRYLDNDAQVRKNIFIDIVIQAQNDTARDVHTKVFGGAADLDKVIADAATRMDPNSVQYAQLLENVAFAYPYFQIKKQPLIPIIQQAIQIRQRLGDGDTPAIAHDKFMIAYRLAALGGNFVPPALESYDIWKKLSDAKDARLKSVAFQPSMLRLAFLLADDWQTRPKALELANLVLANSIALSPSGDLATSSIPPREKYGLGVLFEALGEYAKAQASYEAASSYYVTHNMPEDTVRALIARARIGQLSGDYDAAWLLAKEAEGLCQKAWGANYYLVNKTGLSGLEVFAGGRLQRHRPYQQQARINNAG